MSIYTDTDTGISFEYTYNDYDQLLTRVANQDPSHPDSYEMTYVNYDSTKPRFASRIQSKDPLNERSCTATYDSFYNLTSVTRSENFFHPMSWVAIYTVQHGKVMALYVQDPRNPNSFVMNERIINGCVHLETIHGQDPSNDKSSLYRFD